ncbi:hypothetical protein BJ994_000069 [Arthrobacter pigmenti]|uniref:Uncharacterized protein n=1 Tax=Arthrobacter pigmenti TaxID=271432 RepID=A0A846RDD1_9MICC|nr:hypothetical protein [Arthrobacter pigmenti]
MHLALIEHRPADIVAQPLIIQNQLVYLIRKLAPLPLALTFARCRAELFRHISTYSLDRVGSGAQLMRGNVGNRTSLTSSKCGVTCWATQLPGCPHRMTTRRTRLHHANLTTRPSPSVFNGFARPWVAGLGRLKEMEDMLRARRSPQSKQSMIFIREAPATANRDESRVPDTRKNHESNTRSLEELCVTANLRDFTYCRRALKIITGSAS